MRQELFAFWRFFLYPLCCIFYLNLSYEFYETVLILFNVFLMPSKRCFFYNISVTMEPHCAFDVVKKSLVYMSNKYHQ